MNLALAELLEIIDEVYAEGGIGDVKRTINDMMRRSEEFRARRKVKGITLKED